MERQQQHLVGRGESQGEGGSSSRTGTLATSMVGDTIRPTKYSSFLMSLVFPSSVVSRWLCFWLLLFFLGRRLLHCSTYHPLLLMLINLFNEQAKRDKDKQSAVTNSNPLNHLQLTIMRNQIANCYWFLHITTASCIIM